MKQNDQFKELAKKAYLNYHEDGVLDLIMGASCLGIAAFFGTGNIVFNMFSWMPILFFMPLKNRITFPRIGYVKFDTRRGRPAKLILLMTVTIVLGLFVLGTVFFLNTGRVDPAVRSWIGEHLILILGLLFAVILTMVAFTTSIRRLYAYAGIAAALFIASFVLRLAEFAGFLALGGVVFISGVVRVVRFLRKYPIPIEE